MLSHFACAGVRGLFTGYLPTLLEDVPDMAFKFAAYESMRSLHERLRRGRKAGPQVRETILLELVELYANVSVPHVLRAQPALTFAEVRPT